MIAALAGIGIVALIATMFIASARRPKSGKRDDGGDTYASTSDASSDGGCDSGGDGGGGCD